MVHHKHHNHHNQHHKHHKFSFGGFIHDIEKDFVSVSKVALKEGSSIIRTGENGLTKMVTTGEQIAGSSFKSLTQFIPLILIAGVGYVVLTQNKNR
jgi:hypothetical protein